MSKLFEPITLGDREIRNRFVRAATYEAMAKESGEVTERVVDHYRRLARGEVGLIITGHVFVHPLGRGARRQLGLHRDDMIPGLRRLTEAVHEEGGKIALELAHAGRQTTRALIGQTPLAPSSRGRDPVNFVKPKRMDDGEIREAIQAFGEAARRAAAAGADGVELHAAHGYLVNQFLSPFFNVRSDDWGGSAENRFGFLRRVILEMRRRLPKGMPILVKLNTRDHTPQQGITPTLAAVYARWLAELEIDGLEVSCGSTLYAPFNMSRGDVPISDFVQTVPWWQRPVAWWLLRSWAGRYDLEDAYNLEAARLIKPELGSIPLILTGGLRRVSQIEPVLQGGTVDLVSMSRPFIREPSLVPQIREGRTDGSSCISCNRCLAAVARDMPVRCYYRDTSE